MIKRKWWFGGDGGVTSVLGTILPDGEPGKPGELGELGDYEKLNEHELLVILKGLVS